MLLICLHYFLFAYFFSETNVEKPEMWLFNSVLNAQTNYCKISGR